jgi:hypothetical protein
MATSGSVDFSVSRDDLIKTALQYIEAIGEGVTPNATQLSECSILLNMLVKARMVDGMPLWALKTGYVLPQSNVNDINLGPSGDHATLTYTQTTTTTSSLSGATTITVASVTGFTNGYNIGVELNSGDMQWTTISGAPAGLVITLTVALTGDVASGAQVYAYQTKIQRPLRILDVFKLDVISNTRNPINIVSKSDLLGLGDLTSESEPNQVCYDPQLINGIFSVFPRFQNGDHVIQIRFHRPFEDFDGAADTPDFPQEFYLPLMIELAALCGPKYGVEYKERKTLFQEAQYYFDRALSNGTEQASFNIQPDTR